MLRRVHMHRTDSLNRLLGGGEVEFLQLDGVRSFRCDDLHAEFRREMPTRCLAGT